MTEKEANELLKKYKLDQCTEAERALVEEWFLQYNEQQTDLFPDTVEEISQKIRKQLPKADKIKISVNGDYYHDSHEHRNPKLVKFIKAIAAVLALFFFGYGNYIYFNKSAIVKDQASAKDIKPGSNKATLTLANGKKINLSAAKTGVIIDVNELTYSDGTPIENSGQTDGTQTLTTPNGGQYQLILKDGTKIWLNSASTLTFKTSPSYLATREVSLSGEAYFEIAKDKDWPFRVLSNGQVIEVLGTHFNVTAYKEESITRTTLLEGSVKVNNNVILTPGQQSLNDDGQLTVKEADLSLETAWKSGKIQFEDADLKTVMNMLARWYNITPHYEYYPEEGRFTGSISRYKNISEVLKLLESTNEVHFKITGRRVTTIR